MDLKDIIEQTRKDLPVAKALVLDNLAQIYEGIKNAKKNFSEMSIPHKAAYLFSLGVPAIVLQANCGGSGGSDNNTYIVAPVPDNGDYLPAIDFTGIDNYFLINTHIAGNVEDDLVVLGGQSVDDLQTVGISTDELRNRYETNDNGFQDLFRDVYKPLLQALNTQNGNAPLTDDQLNLEVDNLVANLVDGVPAGLDNENYGPGISTVFFGSNMIAYRMISQPPLNTQFVMITLAGLHTPTGAQVDETAMATLYDVVNAGANDGFGDL